MVIIVPVAAVISVAVLYRRKWKASLPKSSHSALMISSSFDHGLENFALDDSENTMSFRRLSNSLKSKKEDKAIEVGKLDKFLSRQDRILILHSQFEKIPNKSKSSTKTADLPSNKTKNRFDNIIPYDFNRVVLKHGEDYINASYIDGYKSAKSFIAASGPTKETVVDFWQMIWEQNIIYIFMLTSIDERATKKCERYWPDTDTPSSKIGHYVLTVTKETTYLDFTLRHITVKYAGETRQVIHYHLESWQDKSVPADSYSLLNLRGHLRSCVKQGDPPILVHCSAGVGRTGTFLAIDYLLEEAMREGTIDVMQCVTRLREQRPHMVQTVDQYEFVYSVVSDGLRLGLTSFSCREFTVIYPTMVVSEPEPQGSYSISMQFEMLAKVASNTEGHCYRSTPAGALSENEQKNRSTHTIPDENVRVKLKTAVANRNDYINAVHVHTYNRRNVYIATQAPLVGTAVDLWRAVWDYNCGAVVMLCPVRALAMAEIYYPEDQDDIYLVQPFEVTCTSRSSSDGIIKRTMTLSCTSSAEVKRLVHLELVPDLAKACPRMILSLFSRIFRKCRDAASNSPVLVHCLDGVEWTGLYCGFSCLMDQINTDKQVDVFQAVRLIRHARPLFINTQEQYGLLLQLAYLYSIHHASMQMWYLSRGFENV